MSGADGNVTFDLGSAAKEARRGRDLRAGNGSFALHAGGGGRRSGDVETPEGELDNSQSRNGFGNVGMSWTGEKTYVGGSYGYDDTKYGIPIVEGGEIQLTPRRHAFALRAGGQGLTGALDSYRATLSVRRYKHDELEGADVGTAFKNNTAEVELMAVTSRGWPDEGTASGGWFLDRAFGASGAEALSPDVDQRGGLGVSLRGGHLAARRVPVRRPARQHAVHAGRRGRAFDSRAAQGRSGCCSRRPPPTTGSRSR